jgi:hypothetical protein
MSNQVTVLDVKNALADQGFRSSLPPSFAEDLQKYDSNPNCSCNLKIYQKVMNEAKEQVKAYYPNKNLEDPKEQLRKGTQNKFSVVNCSIGELEARMQSLPPGRKQITLARWEDQVTVLVNELENLS